MQQAGQQLSDESNYHVIFGIFVAQRSERVTKVTILVFGWFRNTFTVGYPNFITDL